MTETENKSTNPALVKLSLLDAYVEEGLLSKSVQENLVLYNYTDKCVYTRSWNELTLESRGTIYDSRTGEVVAKAFPKFFNVGETEETLPENLPMNESFRVFEKLDGSLGILYRDERGTKRIATRGSFRSQQALMATDMLSLYDTGEIPDNVTLLFEIIHPENRIVVSYGEEKKLVVLGGYFLDSGEEIPLEILTALATRCGFSVARSFEYSIPELLSLKKTIPSSEEGWVVRFSGGLRVKIKGDDYIKVAKAVSGLSPRSVWSALSEGKEDEYIAALPDELHDDAKRIFESLKSEYERIITEAEARARELGLDAVAKTREGFKEGFQKLKSSQVDELLHPILLAIMRGGDPSAFILRMIRP